MEYEYSKTMKKLMKKQLSLITHIIFALIMAVVVVVGIFVYISEKEQIKNSAEDAQAFDPTIEQSYIYSKITPQYLFQEFATNFDESINYCIAFDDEFNPCIVSFKASDIDRYQELIDYTYSDNDNIPAKVTMLGKSEVIDDSLIEYAVQAYNAIFGEDVVDADSFYQVFGSYYLDTTQKPIFDLDVIFMFILIIVILSIIYFALTLNAKKISKRSQATLDTYNNSILWEVDQEMNEPTTVYFKKQSLYFTRNYLISSMRGLNIIPLSDIFRVYGTTSRGFLEGKMNSLMVEASDGIKHDVAYSKQNVKWEKAFNDVVDYIKLRLPDIEYGFEDGFIRKEDINYDIDVDTMNPLEDKISNVPLGILGAILGAALGGIVWIILGELGYIAGLAGFLMMYLAIQGYRKFSGFLDKKGQIISFIIALLMIFVANYTLYVLVYCKNLYGGYNIRDLYNSFIQLPNFLTLAQIWGDFALDLVIGYVLSILSGFGLIKSIFRKR